MSLKIYIASAGSGKTFALAKEYLQLVISQPQSFAQILAITFTNKATNEMKGRILQYLHGFVTKNPQTDTMLQLLLAENKEWDEAFVRTQAKKVLRLILQQYTRFEIRTIDSFLSQVVRSFAREMGLPNNFRLEIEQKAALEGSLEEMYKHLHENDTYLNWLAEYVNSVLLNENTWKIQKSISDFAAKIFDEKFYDILRNENISLALLQQKSQASQQVVTDFEKKLSDVLRIVKNLLQQYQIPPDNTYFKTYTIASFIKALETKTYSFNNTLRKIAIDEGAWQTKNAKVELPQALNDRLTNILAKTIEFTDQNYANYLAHKLFIKHVYNYGTLLFLSDYVKQYRTDNNLLFNSDISALVSDIFSRNDTAFLYEKTGNHLRYIFIDEFQDTSNFQWNNLRPIVAEAMANDHQALIVGDAKQAIYRWRNGNYYLLLEGVRKDFHTFSNRIFIQNLVENYRSAPNIIQFNNNFFAQITDFFKEAETLAYAPILAELLAKVYENSAQNFPHAAAEAQGYVEISLFDKINDNNSNETIEEEDETAEGEEDAILNYCLATVKKCLADNYLLSDIMILSDRNNYLAYISKFLNTHEFPTHTPSAEKLGNASLLHYIMAAFRFVQTPESVQNIFTLMLQYQFVAGINTANEETLLAAIIEDAEAAIGAYLPKQFVTQKAYLQSLPAYQAAQNILSYLPEYHTQETALNYFFNCLSDLASTGKQQLMEIIHWWETEGADKDIVSNATANAIQLYTVHSAKGLEAKVVIFAFKNITLSSGKGSFWANNLPEPWRDLAVFPLPNASQTADSDFRENWLWEQAEQALERINLAYVAFTRPKERLYIATMLNKKREVPNSLGNILYLSLSQMPNIKQENDRYFVGTPQPNKREITTSVNIETTDLVLAMPQTHTYLQLKTPAFEQVSQSEAAQKVTEGLQAHLVLEHLPNTQQLSETLTHLVEQGQILPTEIPELERVLKPVLARPEVQTWFDTDWQKHSERAIFHQGRRYKPDLVLLRDNKVIVVDYKYEKQSKRHIRQIKKYAEMLASIGYEVISSYLLYIQTNSLLQSGKDF
ncbi:MAG: UvrD-helicase domain-containing protein [Bacteroidetes bacterium]|nr:UvrD-helicase domain-containing protein [Bacteroidota bacterium]